MKTLLLGLIVGTTLGYFWGHGEGASGKPNIARRALATFGVATIERTNRRIEAAIDSTGTTR
jgi:hypothetical protein